MYRKAIVYARQSSGSDDYSESVEVQIANCCQLAASLQIQVVNCLSDLNISGKTYPVGWETLAASDKAFQKWSLQNTKRSGFRPALGELIRQLEAIDCIIVDDITRLYRPLSRSFLEAAVNEALIENQVQILQVKGGSIDLAQFDQQLITMLKNQINDEQIAKQRLRSIEVFNKIRDSGFMPTGITAFGLIYDRHTKRYRPDGTKSEIVKFIFREILADNKYSTIVRQINNRYKELFPSCFWEKSIYSILRKPIYAGYQYNTAGQLIKNHQGEALVSLEDFLQAQKIVEQRRKSRRDNCCYDYTSTRKQLPFSNLLYCGNCGSRLLVSSEKGNTAYYCRRGSLCNCHTCRSSRIMLYCRKGNLAGLMDLCSALLGEALLKSTPAISGNTLDSPHTELPGWYERKLRQVCQEYTSGNLPEYIFHEVLAKLKLQLQSFNNAPPESVPQKTPDQAEQRQQIRAILKAAYQSTLPPVVFKSLLHQAIKRIDVYADKVVIHCPERVLEVKRLHLLRQKGFDPQTVKNLRRSCNRRVLKNIF